MKTCPNCKIEVGGTFEKCPLCQGHLIGDATIDYFPQSANIRQRTLWQNIVLFVLFTSVIVTLSLDFIFIKSGHMHFSLIVLLWVILLIVLNAFLRHNRKGISKIIALVMVMASIGAVLTEIVSGYRGISVLYIVPGIVAAALIGNFILSFIDKSDNYNATFYILWSVLIGVIPCIVIFLRGNRASLAWEICFVISVIVFAGLLVFKGRKVLFEIQKRLHF
ncbi:MAG: hypothetical protein K5886_05700 [Lachnospiraceae bacterium]|nr:hypothetical protein [Lachnospiraceae bacterium]